jgi:hypothetical protein
MRIAVVAFFIALSVVVAIACSSSPPAACSDGCECFTTPETCPAGCIASRPLLPDGASGPFLCADSGAPVCPAPDGAPGSGSTITPADLPAGACTTGAMCTALATGACAALVNGWTCTCPAGTWECVITSAGTAICPADGGAE